jgi:hypothetical protein
VYPVRARPVHQTGAAADTANVGRLRYLLATTLVLAAVGVGVDHVLLAGADQPPPPQIPWSKAASLRANANVKAGAEAIEQYAAAHGNSYRGATVARLRRYDPQLDAGVHIAYATAHGYCLESGIGGAAASESVPFGLVQQSCGYAA